MRTATRKLTNVTTRQKLPKRKKPYYVSVRDRLCLGYLSRWPKGGTWYGRLKTLESDGRYRDEVWKIGDADDGRLADGTTTYSYSQAYAKVTEGRPRPSGGTTHTVHDAVYDYLAHLKATKGEAAQRDAEGKFEKWVLARPIAKTAVNALTLGQLEAWRNGLIQYPNADEADADRERRSKVTANRVLNLLKAALNFAATRATDTGVASDAAWKRLARFKEVEARREHHFSVEDVRKLIAAAEHPAFATLLKAAFFTGARYGELKAMDVRDFDSTAGQLAVRGREGGRKTGRRDVTLTKEAVEFFREVVKGRPADEPLLLAPGSVRWEDGMQSPLMRSALLRAGLVANEETLDTMPRTERPCLYSVRHSFISRALENGAPLFLVAENVGTSVAMIERNYGKFLHAAKRRLIEEHAPKLHAEG